MKKKRLKKTKCEHKNTEITYVCGSGRMRRFDKCKKCNKYV